MKVSDSPYPVGTPEHSRWIKEVYIPDQEASGALERDRELYGAGSIGGRLIPRVRLLPLPSVSQLSEDEFLVSQDTLGPRQSNLAMEEFYISWVVNKPEMTRVALT